MGKSVLSKTLAACIVIPTVWWVYETFIRPNVSVPIAVTTVAEFFEGVGNWVLSKQHQNYRVKMNRKIDQLSSDIDDVRNVIQQVETVDPGRARALKQKLAAQMAVREEALKQYKQFVKEIAKQDLANANRELMVELDAATQRVWTATQRSLELEAETAADTLRDNRDVLGEAVNEFLNALERRDLDAVHAHCEPDLRSELTVRKITQLSRSLPSSHEFGFLPNATAQSCDIVFDGEALLTFRLHDGRWLVAGVW